MVSNPGAVKSCDLMKRLHYLCGSIQRHTAGPMTNHKSSAQASVKTNTFYVVIGSVLMAAFLSLGVAFSQPSPENVLLSSEPLRGNNVIPRPWLLVVGATFLVIYAWGQFNVPERDEMTSLEEQFEPPTHNRCSTTAIRYYSAAALYCLWGLTLYLVFTTWPSVWDEMRRMSTVLDTGKIPPWLAESVTSPLLVALILTILLPKFPVLNALDCWLRAKLRDWARIPHEARRLSKELRKSDDPTVESHTFQVPASMQPHLREQLQRQGFAKEEIVFTSSDPKALPYLWTKASFLLDQVVSWETDPGKFGRFSALHAKELAKLKRRHTTLSGRIKEFLKYRRDNAKKHALDGVLVAYSRDLEADTHDLLSGLYDYLSQAVLHCELTKRHISERLESLGFAIQWTPLRLTIHELVALGVISCIVMLIGFLLVVVPFGRMSPGRAIGLALFIGLKCVIAVVLAIIPKDKQWRIAQAGNGTRPLVAYYLLAGALTVLMQMPISLGYRILLEPTNFSHALNKLLERDLCGWIWISFAISFTTAALIDRDIFGRHALLHQYRRWAEGGVQAVVLAGMGYLIWLMLSHSTRAQPISTSLWGVMTLLGFLGFAVGFCVPTWYREAPRSREGLERLTDTSLNAHESESAEMPEESWV